MLFLFYKNYEDFQIVARERKTNYNIISGFTWCFIKTTQRKSHDQKLEFLNPMYNCLLNYVLNLTASEVLMVQYKAFSDITGIN